MYCDLCPVSTWLTLERLVLSPVALDVISYLAAQTPYSVFVLLVPEFPWHPAHLSHDEA